MIQENIKFLESTFKKYYFEHFKLIQVPNRTSEREFGFQKFNSGMIRHISLKNDKELNLLLMKEVPSDVYCSSACYTFPTLPMKDKDWKESSLIFDIDAKDLMLSCRRDHTVVLCNECGNVSLGNKCTACNSIKVESKSLPCKHCIDASKTQINNLTTILTQDFGISLEEIHVYFSGNEGFHVHVNNSQFQESTSRERGELIDYIMLNGSIPETFGMKKTDSNKSQFPNFNDPGWRGRFAKYVYGSKSKQSKVATALQANGYLSFQDTLTNLSKNVGVKIDPSVTMDTRRIFRLPGSLNSKSGLTKLFCDNLSTFNPYNDASFLSDETVEVDANCPITFRLKNKKFGPYNNETVTVPTYAAVYMICKKLAKIH